MDQLSRRPLQTGNNGAVLSDNRGHDGTPILNIRAVVRILPRMKPRRLLLAALVAFMAPGIGATQADAACFAEFKAKRKSPYKLIYDVAQLRGPCTMDSARKELKIRLARHGVILLKVVSVYEQ